MLVLIVIIIIVLYLILSLYFFTKSIFVLLRDLLHKVLAVVLWSIITLVGERYYFILPVLVYI